MASSPRTPGRRALSEGASLTLLCLLGFFSVTHYAQATVKAAAATPHQQLTHSSLWGKGRTGLGRVDPKVTWQVMLHRLINMAYLAVVGSKAVNGVAAIHSEIIKNTIFKVGCVSKLYSVYSARETPALTYSSRWGLCSMQHTQLHCMMTQYS